MFIFTSKLYGYTNLRTSLPYNDHFLSFDKVKQYTKPLQSSMKIRPSAKTLKDTKSNVKVSEFIPTNQANQTESRTLNG